jgi:polyisoprenoid-binding protein YceI
LIVLGLTGSLAVTPGTWSVEQGDVRVVCSMTIGGSFEAKTSALSGSVTTRASGPPSFDGSFAVDLRSLDTGIGLRNEHLRENYLEVEKGPGFEQATVSAIDLKGFSRDTLEGKGSFEGLLTLHGVTRTVTGDVDVRQAGAALHVKASFPVNLSEYSIRKPRYLGVGVKDIVQVEVVFAVTR